MSALDDARVRELLHRAWEESEPGTTNAHEEGGFILRAADGSLTVERWPQGLQNEIIVPPHPGGLCDGDLIVASFHTHPNPEPEFQQEPSVTDVRAVMDDPDLSHAEYEGEFVISRETVYRIRRDGQVERVGETESILNAP